MKLLFDERSGTWAPSPGATVKVVGYHAGDFIGLCESVDRFVARMRVVDPLRPRPRVKSRCSFPECVREDFHGGEHEFVSVRPGAVIEVHWRTARFEPCPQIVRAAGSATLEHAPTARQRRPVLPRQGAGFHSQQFTPGDGAA